MATVGNRLTPLELSLEKVFLLYPDNADFLLGDELIAEFSPTVIEIRRGLVVGVVMLLISLVTFGNLVSPQVKAGSLVSHPAPLGIAIASVVLSTLFVLGGGYFVFVAFRRWRYRQHRKAGGDTIKLIRGAVVSCSASYVYRSTEDYTVSLRYQYQSPITGKMVTAQDTNMRKDLNPQNLPAEGTPVIVVTYDPPIPWGNKSKEELDQGFVL